MSTRRTRRTHQAFHAPRRMSTSSWNAETDLSSPSHPSSFFGRLPSSATSSEFQSRRISQRRMDFLFSRSKRGERSSRSFSSTPNEIASWSTSLRYPRGTPSSSSSSSSTSTTVRKSKHRTSSSMLTSTSLIHFLPRKNESGNQRWRKLWRFSPSPLSTGWKKSLGEV